MAMTALEFSEKTSPLFDETCEEDVQSALDSAALYLSEANWGSRYNDGQFLLAAHFLTELQMLISSSSIAGSATAIASGGIKSEKIKSWSATYADSNSAFDDNALSTTSWGRAFIARRNLVFPVRCF